MMRLPQSLVGSVLYQMQTESGGDPNAVNLWDINAKRGDPSRGLMQVIGSTFARFHVPGTSFNILDPLANIASAINYAMHTYGPNLRNARGGIGSGHGYDIGGWLPTGVTLAYNLTGQKERILSPSEYNSLQAGGTQYHAHFDGLTGVAIESHVRTAFSMMNFTQGAMYRQGRRS
jgi:SLT domain-containing protein